MDAGIRKQDLYGLPEANFEHLTIFEEWIDVACLRHAQTSAPAGKEDSLPGTPCTDQENDQEARPETGETLRNAGGRQNPLRCTNHRNGGTKGKANKETTQGKIIGLREAGNRH